MDARVKIVEVRKCAGGFILEFRFTRAGSGEYVIVEEVVATLGEVLEKVKVFYLYEDMHVMSSA